jgi:hypothetical protein
MQQADVVVVRVESLVFFVRFNWLPLSLRREENSDTWRIDLCRTNAITFDEESRLNCSQCSYQLRNGLRSETRTPLLVWPDLVLLGIEGTVVTYRVGSQSRSFFSRSLIILGERNQFCLRLLE